MSSYYIYYYCMIVSVEIGDPRHEVFYSLRVIKLCWCYAPLSVDYDWVHNG